MSASKVNELELIYLFVHVVNAGSMSAAARTLEIPVATVSRKLARLEELQDRLLLMRNTRKLRLTEEGLTLFQRYCGLISQFDELSCERNERPEGTLRLAAPIAIVSMVLMPAFNAFCRRYPDIRLHISQSNQAVDLIDEGVDVAIVGGRQPDSSWVSRTLGVLDYKLMASPGYLQNSGTPTHPNELDQHRLIKVWPLYHWHLTRPSGESFFHDGAAHLTLSDLHGAILSAVDDGGILYGPELFAREQIANGELEVLLPDWIGEQRRISLLYHQRIHQPLKVSLFLEFMEQQAPGLFGSG
ncbi:LysR family transcriptional regulator [Shewanella sp. GXUN23E]|uniref:LysR family transcriptional regulator n=1 Tax=Shewanella sp. GXUN23E TaxID=3422498 RepID=UPI003D7E7346